MARTPFPAPPPPSAPPSPAQRPAAPIGGPIPGSTPIPGASGGARPALNERRTLVVGRGISVQGTVQDAERLVVEGTVESSLISAAELSVAQGGVFRGAVEVEDAEVAGTIDGTLTARGNLIVRATGRLIGTAKCRRLQVEDGGQVSGHLEMITGEAPKPEPARPAAPEAAAPLPSAAPATV